MSRKIRPNRLRKVICMITNEEFRKLQLTQLEIMDEVHRICQKNKISYYMIGGTALGAVRHQGFIPWDLDIDIAMKRADYDQFKSVCKTELNERFIYRDYTNTHNYDHPHALVCIKNTVLVNKFDKFNPDFENLGIYLDVFPLDNAPEDEVLQRKQTEDLTRIKKIKQYKVAMCYFDNPIKNFVKKFVSKMIFWTSIDKLNVDMDKCMRRYNQEDTGYLCSMASHYSYKKQFMAQDIYGTPQLMVFEDRRYYCPEKVDDYLKKIYGDYMKLPPESEREANLSVFEKVVFDT